MFKRVACLYIYTHYERVCVCVCVYANAHTCTVFRVEHVFVLAHNGGHISHELIPIVSEKTYGLRGNRQEAAQPHDTLATDSILRAQMSAAAACLMDSIHKHNDELAHCGSTS